MLYAGRGFRGGGVGEGGQCFALVDPGLEDRGSRLRDVFSVLYCHRRNYQANAASKLPFCDRLLDERNGPSRVEPFRAGLSAVHGMTPIKPERIVQGIQTSLSGLVASSGDPAPRVQQGGRPKIPMPGPPPARARRGAAEAKDALPVTVDPRSLFGRLKTLPIGRRCRFRPHASPHSGSTISD